MISNHGEAAKEKKAPFLTFLPTQGRGGELDFELEGPMLYL